MRELKARLSYYLQLVQTGEIVAITLRNTVIGFLTHHKPADEPTNKTPSRKRIDRTIAQMKADGLILKGGAPYRHRPHKRVTLAPGPTSTEIIRRMRDEDWL